MKDGYDFMKELPTDTFGCHSVLKGFIKTASYGPILFHLKGYINEGFIKLDVNSQYATAMTAIKIPKGNLKRLINSTLGIVLILSSLKLILIHSYLNTDLDSKQVIHTSYTA